MDPNLQVDNLVGTLSSEGGAKSQAAKMNSHAISTLVTILFLIGLASRACCASTSQKSHQGQHLQQQQQLQRNQHQLQQQQATTTTNDNGEILRQLLQMALYMQNKQIQQQQQLDELEDNSLAMLIKRKPMAEAAELPATRQPANMNEHARNILDDTLGIRRDSIFTTNNHLGLKGVPKFGSDEQF